MNITYDYYRIFYYVSKYKNFTHAAAVLRSNQPNITRAINNLEKQLGCRLFIRSNRGVTLTPEGKKLFTHVQIAYEQLKNAEMELSDAKDLQNGMVTIGATETALHGLVLSKLKIFHDTYPGIKIKITNNSTPEAIKSLKNGLIDFAVVTAPTDVSYPLKEVPLKYFHEILLAGMQYKELADKPHTLKDLSDYPLICLGQGTKTYDFYTKLYLNHGLTLNPDIEAATTDLIIPMIKDNLGIGFVPENFINNSINNNELVQIELKEKIPVRSICLIKDVSHPLSMAASRLEELLHEKSN